jgi:AhpD family alkylhydroperoxidase
MPTNEERLTPEQRELVAIGASVGAGCLPCSSFHFKQSRAIGLEADRMLAAALEAAHVVGDANERLSVHVHEELDPEADEPAEMPRLDRELAALGASITANSLPNMRRHLIKASECGLSGKQLAEAIRVAAQVQKKAGEGHIEEAARFLEHLDGSSLESDASDDDACAGDCGCHSKEAADVL